SSTHSTSAHSGGFRYNPTMSRTFSTKNGSVDNLKVSTRCGCNENARQMREMADCDIRVAWAMVRVDQCVPCGGVDSNVRVIRASTCASVILRGAPGRGSSASP